MDEIPAEQEYSINIPLAVVRAIVFSIGIVGNLTVIFVIFTLREYKKAVTHWYVLQLAIADSLYLLTIPFRIDEDIRNKWIFSTGFCKVKETVLFLNYYSSILFLMVMSVDRYIAVCHGFSNWLQKLRSTRAAYWITAVVWITSLLLSIPITVYSDVMGRDPTCRCLYHFKKTSYEYCKTELGAETEEHMAECADLYERKNHDSCIVEEQGNNHNFTFGSGELTFPFYGNDSAMMGDFEISHDFALGEYDVSSFPTTSSFKSSSEYEDQCSYKDESTGWKIFISFNFIVMFLLPFILMSVCYTLIILRLKKTRVRADSTAERDSSMKGKVKRRTRSTASTRADKNLNQVTIICGVLVWLFLVCWLPFHALHLSKLSGIKGTTKFCITITAVVSLISYVNSALNPFVYNFIGTKFRRRLRSAVGAVGTSIKSRTSSVASNSVRYHHRTNDEGSISHQGTVTTKIFKGKDIGVRVESSSPEVFEDNPTTHHECKELLGNGDDIATEI